MYRQSSYVEREELEMITVIYQIKIRFFREGNSSEISNVTCIEEIGRNYGRVVNMLCKNGEWAVLKYDSNQDIREQQVDREDRERNRVLEEFREEESRKIERCREKEEQKQIIVESPESRERESGNSNVEGDKGLEETEGYNSEEEERRKGKVMKDMMTIVAVEGSNIDKGKTQRGSTYGETEELNGQGREGSSECSSIDLLDIKKLDQWLEQRVARLSISSEIAERAEIEKGDGQHREREGLGEQKTITQSIGLKQNNKEVQGRRNGNGVEEEVNREEVLKERAETGKDEGERNEREGRVQMNTQEYERREEHYNVDKRRKIRDSGKTFINKFRESGEEMVVRELDKAVQFKETTVQEERKEKGKTIMGRDNKQKGEKENRRQCWDLESECSSIDLLDKKELDKWLEKWVAGKEEGDRMDILEGKSRRGENKQEGGLKRKDIIDRNKADKDEKRGSRAQESSRRECIEVEREIGRQREIVDREEKSGNTTIELGDTAMVSDHLIGVGKERKKEIGWNTDKKKGSCEGQYNKTDSECSSIDLLDKRELDKWLEQQVAQLNIGKEKEEDTGMETISKGRSIRIESGDDREKKEEKEGGSTQWEERKESIERDQIERKEWQRRNQVVRDKKEEDKALLRIHIGEEKGQKEEIRGSGEGGRKERKKKKVQSEKQNREKGKLEGGVGTHRVGGSVIRKEETENRQGMIEGEDNRVGVRVGGQRDIEKDEGESGSDITTSSIEALFWDRQIGEERECRINNEIVRDGGLGESKYREEREKKVAINRKKLEKEKKERGGVRKGTEETGNGECTIKNPDQVEEEERQSIREGDSRAASNVREDGIERGVDKREKLARKGEPETESREAMGTDGQIEMEIAYRREIESGSLNQQGRERERDGEDNVEERESNITTSTIEALFWDGQTERRSIRIGSKKITRRKVWERWRGVVRGVIRRNIRKKRRVERKEEKEKEENRLVFDYTTKGLSIEEMQLLGKGEGFCVVDHKIDEDRNRVDIYNYQRRLRLHELFRDPGNREDEEENIVEGSRRTPARRRTDLGGDRVGTTQIGSRASRGSIVNTQRTGRRESGVSRRSIGRSSARVSRMSENRRASNRVEEEEGRVEEKGRRLPSIYDPDSQNRNLNRYNVCIQEEIMLSMEKKVQFRDNIPRLERKALKILKNRIEEKEIIITRADKGSGLVAVDYNTYISKGTRYIEEEAGAYTKVQETEACIIGRLTKDRNKIADQLKEKGVITAQTTTYIKKQLEEKITGIKFYYKIHKDRKIETMPLRPLQSCIKAPMHHLSIVLTDILQPLLTEKNIPSFIFDSNQLLYRLSNLGRIPDSCTLISSDVSALYPSIPHREGFNAMKIFLQQKTSYNIVQINNIIRALELVITENYMTWNRQIYKQVSGVAMGTPVAVAYANIFMDWVDKQVRQRAPYIYEHIRFIDDNLFILPNNRVEELMEIANSILPPHIKFTYEKLDGQVGKGLPFLDTQLFISEEKKIESRLYTKKTDRHAYLLPSSYHPPHITKNIPTAVFGRIKKICSRDEWFSEDAEKAEGWLLNRGYKKTEIKKAVDRTSQKDRWEMIEQIEKNRHIQKQKEEGAVVDIPFIITYNQHGAVIKKVLKDRQPLLDSAFRRTKVRPRLSYRRRRNLNDIIVQKGLRGPIEENRRELNIFSECGEKPGYRSRCPCRGKHSQEQCRCCMHRQAEIEGVESKIYKPVNCNSKNVVYIIGCRKCSKKYIGETQQRLKDRLAQHMYNVEKLNQPLYLHFRYVHKLENLYIGILETVKGGEPFMRKVREGWWINYLKTLEPRGFNVKLECNQVYEATS